MIIIHRSPVNHLRYPKRTAIAWSCALLLLTGLLPLRAQVSVAYEEPDLAAPAFDLNRLSLDPAVRSRLSTVLAAGVTYYNAILDEKILGIALRLDPANRAAKDAADHRKRGELPDAKSGNPTFPTATVVSYLAGQSSGLRTKGGSDNLTLAFYLSDIAAGLDPDNPAAKYEKSVCAKFTPPPGWMFLKGKSPDAPESLPLLKKQSKIRGLSVRELPNGDRAGAVLEIIVTAEDARSRQEVGVTTSRPVGESMKVALDEAWRTVKLRHPAFGAGQRVVLSFDDKYTGKDGPSAGAAFTLALYSLYDPLKLAADAAMTGDITVDGRIRPVGAVPWKIHAAQVNGCRVVAVPKANAGEVADVPLIFPPNTLWKLQILTVDTLDEALAVMREDRPANLQKAMDLFAAVQRQVGLETPNLNAAGADLVPKLEEILRLAPGHASADAMLKMLEQRSAATMTIYTSLDEVEQIARAAWNSTPYNLPAGQGNTNVEHQTLSAAAAQLDALRPRLDLRLLELCSAEAALLRSFVGPVAGQRAEMERCLAKCQLERQRIFTNPAVVEALKH